MPDRVEVLSGSQYQSSAGPWSPEKLRRIVCCLEDREALYTQRQWAGGGEGYIGVMLPFTFTQTHLRKIICYYDFIYFYKVYIRILSLSPCIYKTENFELELIPYEVADLIVYVLEYVAVEGLQSTR